MRDAAVLQQPDHGRHANGVPRRMDVRLRLFFGRRHALQHQHQRRRAAQMLIGS